MIKNVFDSIPFSITACLLTVYYFLTFSKVYLARQQGISHGKVSWKFRIDDSSYFINQIEIKASSNTFENGKVEWFLENDTVKEEVPTG